MIRNQPNPAEIPRIHKGLAAICALLALLFGACQMPRNGAALASAGPPKRVEIDKTTQTLRAYEGDALFLETRVSTGRRGHRTPSGDFRAGEKHRMHYSRLYHNAPMPFSVQVSGNYFIHGYKEVPAYPASHGCIRVPLTGDNPAAIFYEWAETGMPIRISGEWQGK